MKPSSVSKVWSIVRLLLAAILLLSLFAMPKGVLASHSEEDIDGDGVPNTIDNCPAVYNPAHNPYEPLPLNPNPQFDADQDGLGNPCDDDFESQYSPPEGYVDVSGGVAVFFADDNGEPLQYPDTNCFSSILFEGSGLPPSTMTNYCVSISHSSPPYFFHWCSGGCFYNPAYGPSPVPTRLTFHCAEGGSYTYDIKGKIVEMIALNTNCELVQQQVWVDTADEDYDDDGVPNSEDNCPLEYGATPDGCPVVCEQHAEKWRGYVYSLGLENDLYYYETIVDYCYSETYAEITSARFYGDVDSGFDEAGLSLLGFTPKYRPDLSGSAIDSNQMTANMYAQFDMCFDAAVFLDKLGIKKTLEDKAVGFLSKKIASILSKYGGLSGPKASQKLLQAVDELGNRLLTTADEAIEEAVPGPIGDYLEDKVEEWLTQKIQKWEDSVRVAVTSGTYTNLTSDEIAASIAGLLAAELQGLTEVCFETWQPTFTFSVLPGGSISHTLDDVFTNPFLSVDQVY